MSRVGVRRKMCTPVCIMCRHPFQSSRWDARTCGAKCRKRWERFQAKQDALGVGVSQIVDQENRLMSLFDKVQERVFARVK